ncbi:MAG: OmpA family protein, partial [Bacteroidota bacterium]
MCPFYRKRVFESLALLLLICVFSPTVQGQRKIALPQLSSSFKETNLSITPNGKYLFFMSDRGGQVWSEEWDPDPETGERRFDGDIWYSTYLDGEWLPAKCLNATVNTLRGEDEPNITSDGQRVYFQSWRDNWRYNGGPYYMAQLNGAVWTNLDGLGGEITRFFSELGSRMNTIMVEELTKANLLWKYRQLVMRGVDDPLDTLRLEGFEFPNFSIATDGMAVSPDEKTFIVSVYIPETENYDLMISHKNKKGNWSYPKSLSINSPADEKSVFIAGDNKTIYFSSSRAGGYGGLDVYSATLGQKRDCSEPENLGSALNTAQDDEGFILTANGKRGFMASDGNIYEIDLDMEPPSVLVIDGVVVNQDSFPLATRVELTDLSTGEILYQTTSNFLSGEYGFSLSKQLGDFQQTFYLDGELVETINFNVKEDSPDELSYYVLIPEARSPDIPKDLYEKEVVVGEVFRLDKIQFAANEAVIDEISHDMLNELAALLIARQDLVVEIGGHTNGIPGHEFCDNLSQNRANAVRKYLLDQEVPGQFLAAKGYGKRSPVASNKNLEGR